MSTPYPYPDGGDLFTSGWSGSETSHQRALSEDASGVTAQRQDAVRRYVTAAGYYGKTVKEVRDHLGLHHGQVSSALSVLHKEGRLARLTETRDRCAVYVYPTFVQGRETASHGRSRPSEPVQTLNEHERLVLDRAKESLAQGWIVPNRDVRVIVEALERLS